MRTLFRLHWIILLLCFITVSRADTHTLFRSGKTDYVILVSNDASISEKYAATELQYWLKEISGATFPIVNSTRKVNRKRIVVGYIPEVMQSYKMQRPDDSDQGFVYGNRGEDIYIVGGRDYGTLYGVYSFLENEFSCRWYTKDATLVPRRERWAFTELYDKESPAFEHRNIYYFDAFDVDWSLRNKNNGKVYTKETAFGTFPTTGNAIWGVHTFDMLIPSKTYFESHPEYYSLRDGKRTKDQLCLSNPSVVQLCKDNLRKIIKKNPQYHVYSIAQNDHGKPCQCKKCQALVEKYGGESGAIIWFVNQIAASLESEFPDKLFGTFAYSYSRKAPSNIYPRKNVLIRLCTSHCCESHPLDRCKNNESFINDISQWSKLTSSISIWDYVVSFRQYLLPFPNIKILQKNIQTYRKYKACGVMNEGVYNTPGGDFYELRAYLLAKLLWNPDIDVDAVVDDFMKGYYQNAAPFMKSYYELVQNLATQDIHFRHTFNDAKKVYSSDFISSSLSLLTKAEKAANSDVVRERVQRQKMVIAFMHCKKNPEQAIQDGSFELVMNMSKKLGMTKFSEYGENKSIDDFTSKMEQVRKSMKNKYSKEYLEYKFSRFLDSIKI